MTTEPEDDCGLEVLERTWQKSAPRPFPVADAVRLATSEYRARTFLLGLVAILTVPLTMIGVTGALTFATKQRAREHAIELAMGADARRIRGRVVRQAMTAAGAASVMGLGLGVGVGRWMSTALFGVRAASQCRRAVVPVPGLRRAGGSASGRFADFDYAGVVKILSAELVTSASTAGPRAGLLRDDLPRFSFAGRSNVGKSSLLNALMRQRLARTSAAAGKTRQANIYRVTVGDAPGGPGRWSVYLVDLPGYGYARGGDQAVEEMAAVADAYFAAAHGSKVAHDPGTERRRGASFLLVDSRHPGLPSDLQAYHWISEAAGEPVVVATKIDTLSRSERARNLRELERIYQQPPVPVSAAKGEGLDVLWRLIAATARGEA